MHVAAQCACVTLFFGDPLSRTFCVGLDVKTMQVKAMSRQRRVFSKTNIHVRGRFGQDYYAAGDSFAEVCFTISKILGEKGYCTVRSLDLHIFDGV